jgi:hypothetical protein
LLSPLFSINSLNYVNSQNLLLLANIGILTKCVYNFIYKLGWLNSTSLQPTRVQVLDLTLMLVFFWICFRPFSDVCSVRGDVPIDYEDVCDDFVNFKVMCRLSLSEVQHISKLRNDHFLKFWFCSLP